MSTAPLNTRDATQSATGNPTFNQTFTHDDFVLRRGRCWRRAALASPVSSSCFRECRTQGPTVRLGPCSASWCTPPRLHLDPRGQKYWKVKQIKHTWNSSHFKRKLRWLSVSLSALASDRTFYTTGTFMKCYKLADLSTSLLRHR